MVVFRIADGAGTAEAPPPGQVGGGASVRRMAGPFRRKGAPYPARLPPRRWPAGQR
jgi:hypothetical protein